jgi:hypothetical protein
MKLLPCSIALAASILCASGASAVTLGPYSGSWDASDSVQTGRIYRNTVASDASSPKGFPGDSNATSSFRYETFLFENLGGLDAITVDATVSSSNTHLSAFSGSVYDPIFANNASIYLGDLGSSSSQPFSFMAPTGTFMVVASTNFGGDLTGNFSFTVNGTNIAAVSAVPEPGTLAMFGLGVGVLGVVARRRKTA